MATLFPGGSLLFETLIDSHTVIENLLDEVKKTNLSGFCEVRFPQTIGLVFFYSGEPTSVIFKSPGKVSSGQEGLEDLKDFCHQHKGGKLSVYELPNDVAFMLRGLTNRTQITAEADWSGRLRMLIDELAEEKYTGALDVITSAGKGLILLVGGKISTTSFEIESGIVFSGKDGLEKIYQVMDKPGVACKIYKSDFSAETWKERQILGIPRESRIYQVMEERIQDITRGGAAPEAPAPPAEPASKQAPESAPSQPAQAPPLTPPPEVKAPPAAGPARRILVEFSRQVNHLSLTALLAADGTAVASVVNQTRFQGPQTTNLLAMLADAAVKAVDLMTAGSLEDVLVITDTDYVAIKRIADGRFFHTLILSREGNLTQARLLMGNFEPKIAEALIAAQDAAPAAMRPG
ncbi:MAG: hypothetical protein A2V83_10140 [Nitrospirae bacterium RBG_16_64_22]|nr:MAG: hypothetical protein A2V83_10140 [Nitrospirae bacterium RBG_16_64_22]